MSEERLQKVMAAAGVGSRRACERLIEAGRVIVDGQTITELGTKVNPNNVKITVDGKIVNVAKRLVYMKVHKPRGMLSDIGGDTRGRQSVSDLLSPSVGRVFTVGRLDLNSEGLLLLTNDGEMAHRLTHPRFEHPKTYFVLVEKMPKAADLHALRHGIDIQDGRTAPAQITRVDGLPVSMRLDAGPTAGVWLRFVLREGKKRQIRHMVSAVGLSTLRLVRWAIGPLTLGGLPAGQWRYLPAESVTALQRATTDNDRSGTTHRSGKSRSSASRRRNTRPPGRHSSPRRR